jgi:copper chaperone CopZ
MTTIASYAVTGMTCGHCVAAVTDEVNALPGVENVTVDLHPGGTSTVSVASSAPLDAAAVRAAIDEAGYQLDDPPTGHEARR